MLLHRLEQRSLRLRWRAINLISEKNVAKDRPLNKGPLTMASCKVLFNDVSAGNIGWHQIRCELNATKFKTEGFSNGSNHQCLRRARHACHQTVTTNEEGDQHLIENFVLADDNLAHLSDDTFPNSVETFNAVLELRCIGFEIGKSSHQT